ncbi:hypothetical protein GGQ02_003257 [Salinibacter ruber]|nr:hypothetical protein [Salinibacter ruber]
MSMPHIFNVRNKKDISKPRRASLTPLFLGCPRCEDEIAVDRFTVRVASLAELDLNLLDTIDAFLRQKE